MTLKKPSFIVSFYCFLFLSDFLFKNKKNYLVIVALANDIAATERNLNSVLRRILYKVKSTGELPDFEFDHFECYLILI